MGLRMYGIVFKSIFDSTLRPIYLKNSLVLGPNYQFVSMSSGQLEPPTAVRGMKLLEKELFKKFVDVPCLIVPVTHVSKAKNTLKSYFLKLENFRPVQEMGEGSKLYSDKFSSVSTPSKIAVLNPDKIKCFTDLRQEHREILHTINVIEDNFVMARLEMGYDNWRASQILRAVIPEELESVSSYSICGHIVHLNLREQLEEFKTIVGQVLLEKVTNARTVVNKTDNIDSTYRTFKMEVLAGDEDFTATVKENRCSFIFDFSNVYWNSRLCTEHERIVNVIKSGDVLFDVFCGVGPFSIPASKKGCKVFANDLNPESIKWLKKSAEINKTQFSIFCKDGDDFIRGDLKNELLRIDEKFDKNIHVVMNLPAIAIEFLPSFKGLFDRNEIEHISKLPRLKIYVYCFTKGERDSRIAAKEAVESMLGRSLKDDLKGVQFVRNVAPMKEMMRVDFELPLDVLIRRDKRPNENGGCGSSKKSSSGP